MCDFGLLAFETAPVGIVLAENRVIRSCNKTFANMLGYHVENLVGQSFRMLYGSDDEFEHVRDVGLTRLKEMKSTKTSGWCVTMTGIRFGAGSGRRLYTRTTHLLGL